MNYTPNPSITSGQPSVMPKPLRYIYRPADMWLALVLWLVGYLYVAAVPIGENPVPALVVQVILFAGALMYLSHRSVGGCLTPWAVTLAVVGIALSVSFLWTVNRAMMTAVAAWNAFAWFYLIFVLTGNSRERGPGQFFIGEVLTATVRMPFRAPGNLFGAIFGQRTEADGTPRKRSRVSGAVGWAVLGLFLAIIPTIIIVLLLSYDQGFSRMMNDILDTIFEADTVFRFIRDALIGLMVGALMFGALLAGRTKALEKPHNGVFDPPVGDTASNEAVSTVSNGVVSTVDLYSSAVRKDGAHILPVALVAAMLTPILAVYVIFFVSQWAYYVSAFTGARPEELTFSAYAREGFFQLVAVAVINAVLSIGAAALSVRRAYDPERPGRERRHPMVRMYLAVLALFTLVLIATALSKMILYVDTYGLSHKRVYATWLMLLLAVAFVAVIVRQVWTRMNLVGTLTAVFLSFFLVIALCPVDALIVRYNVNEALGGNLHTMVGDVCEDSGASGVIAALDFMAATEAPGAIFYDPAEFDAETLEELRRSTDAYLEGMAEELGERAWYAHNITTLRAKAALRNAGYTPTPDEAEDADMPDDIESAETTRAPESETGPMAAEPVNE